MRYRDGESGPIRDDFAAGGGWDEGLRMIGLTDVVGIEWDGYACATARAAGHERIQADISEVDNAEWQHIDGYIASPPCTTFSLAGHGGGRKTMEIIAAGLEKMAQPGDPRPEVRQAVYTALLRTTWRARVDLYKLHCAQFAAGKLTREPRRPTMADAKARARDLGFISSLVLEPVRAIRDIRPRWVALEQVPPVLPLWEVIAEIMRRWGYSVETGVINAADYGVPQTRKRAILVGRLDGVARLPAASHVKGDPPRGLRKWRSMGEALGWTQPLVGSSGTAGFGQEPGERDADDVAFTLTGHATEWKLKANHGGTRPVSEHSLDEPAPTTTSVDVGAWAWERPATTMVGSFRPDIVAAPGYRSTGDGPRQDAPGSIPITAAEASVIQSFPADYPWQGPKTSVFQQIGNAIPPRMAAAIVGGLLEIDWVRAVESSQ